MWEHGNWNVSFKYYTCILCTVSIILFENTKLRNKWKHGSWNTCTLFKYYVLCTVSTILLVNTSNKKILN